MIQNIVTKIRGDQNLKSLLKHSGIMYVSGAVSTLLLIIQQITTANIIGPTDYGRFATVVGSSLLIMYIMDVRTWEAGVKLLARPILDKDNDEITRIITWLTIADVITGLMGAMIIVLLSQAIATHLLRAPDLQWLVSVYALSIPFRMLANGIARTTIRMYNRFDWLSLKSILYGLLRIIFVTGAALLGLNLQGVVISAVLVEIIGTTIIIGMEWRIQKRELELPHNALFDFRKPRQFKAGLKMLRGVWLSATLQGLQIEIFVPLLALLTTPLQVGLFRSGLDIAETVEKLSIPLMTVLFPQIVNSHEQNTRNEFMRLIRQSSLLMAVLTIPFLIGVILFGPLLLPRLMGAEFTGVATIAAILAAGYTIYSILMWTRPALITFNYLFELNLISVITIVMSVVGLVILAPIYGAVAGATVSASAMLLLNLLSLLVFRHRLPQAHFQVKDSTA